MDIQVLTKFFMWCTVMNGALLTFWTLCLLLMPDLTFRTQRPFLRFERQTWEVVMYCFLGFFKIVFIAGSLVPFLALVIVG